MALRTKNLLGITLGCAVLIGVAAGFAFARGTPDEMTPAEETVCDGLSGSPGGCRGGCAQVWLQHARRVLTRDSVTLGRTSGVRVGDAGRADKSFLLLDKSRPGGKIAGTPVPFPETRDGSNGLRRETCNELVQTAWELDDRSLRLGLPTDERGWGRFSRSRRERQRAGRHLRRHHEPGDRGHLGGERWGGGGGRRPVHDLPPAPGKPLQREYPHDRLSRRPGAPGARGLRGGLLLASALQGQSSTK